MAKLKPAELIDEKQCTQCKQVLALHNFHKARWAKGGRNTKCKGCLRKYQADWKKKNPEKRNKQIRNNHLKRIYGISIDEYNSLYLSQDGKCKICLIHQTELKKPLYVDHDHKTNRVRGLLCQHCNTLLGFAKDNLTLLERAKHYLEFSL